MKAQLSHKDWELISEYLDGELPAREKNRLDQRLNVQPELRNGLEELRQTRSLLRSVPRRRAPHNFTLTPAMVQRRSLPRLFPVLGFSSALATVLVFLTLFLRLLPGSTAAMQAAPMMKSLETNNAVAQDATAAKPTPLIIQWGAQPNYQAATGRGGSGGGGPEGTNDGVAPQLANPSTLTDNQAAPTEAPAAAAKSMEATPETSAQPMAPALSAPAQPAPLAPPAAPLAQPPATGAATQLKESNPILGVAPKEDEGKIVPQPEAEFQAAQRVASKGPVSAPINWWLIDSGLVFIALATGISAFILWRRSRS